MNNIAVKVYRGNVVESVHRVSVAVFDAEGKSIASFGNADLITCLRSSAKPLQIIPMIEAGCIEEFDFSQPEISVIMGSHNSEPYHVSTVASILEKIGLSESDLSCGIHEPLHKETADKLREEGITLTQLHNNCSGKHSGMLTACVKLGFPTEGYFKPDHPLQEMITDVVCEMTQYPREKIEIGMDNCSVPVFGLPLRNIALGYARLMELESQNDEMRSKTARIIINAMAGNPEMIAGTDRLCTDLMRVAKSRLIAKIGAEGVYCVGVRNKNIGIALKVEDGTWRATAPAILEVLNQLEVLSQAELQQLGRFRFQKIKNHKGEMIGEIRAE